MNYYDQLGRDIRIELTPKRIVSLVPSQTELLVDLGLESSIIGITKFCVHPTKLRKTKIIVGGTKDVHYEKISTLKPDIILCNKEENTKEMIEQLEQIAPVHVSDIYTIEDSLELIKIYGLMFDVATVASALISDINFELKKFNQGVINQPRLKVAYFIWKDPWMVAAHSTFIDEMLRVAHFDNYFAHLSRYPEIELEDIDTSIDLLFFSSEPFPFKDKHLTEIFDLFPKSKVKIVDGEYFSWYGSRMKAAFSYLKTLREEIV